MKLININKLSKAERELCIVEMNLMKQLTHPNIISFKVFIFILF